MCFHFLAPDTKVTFVILRLDINLNGQILDKLSITSISSEQLGVQIKASTKNKTLFMKGHIFSIPSII